jgi:hypothetical protein
MPCVSEHCDRKTECFRMCNDTVTADEMTDIHAMHTVLAALAPSASLGEPAMAPIWAIKPRIDEGWEYTAIPARAALLAVNGREVHEFRHHGALAASPSVPPQMTGLSHHDAESGAGKAAPSIPLDRERKEAEQHYTVTAFNYPEAPVGSRDWTLFWSGWWGRAMHEHAAPAEHGTELTPAGATAEPTFEEYHNPEKRGVER